MKYSLYVLSSSETPENIRYVGYTKKPIHIRLREHISDSKNNTSYKHKWIRKVIKTNNNVLIKVLQQCEDVKVAKELEINLILNYKSLNYKLVNGTNGGDGATGVKMSDENKLRNSILKSKKYFIFVIKPRNY